MQKILVGALVLLCAGYIVYRFSRKISGMTKGEACGTSCGCSERGKEKAFPQLKEKS